MILIPALAIPMPFLAQAYGNLFVPALLLVFGLGMMLYWAGRRVEGVADGVRTGLILREVSAPRQSEPTVQRL